MGNLGMPELMMIMLLALLLFGPKKLPEIGKQVGKALGEFKRASNDLKRSIQDEMDKAQAGLDSISNDLKPDLKLDLKAESKPEPKPEPPALTPAAGAVAQQKPTEPGAPSTPTTPS
jgi:TatA/E family protein of Tat protein translocase